MPQKNHRRLKVAITAVISCIAAMTPTIASATPTSSAAPPQKTFDVEVVSGRPNMISGGDALVRVAVPRNVPPHQVRINVDGRDVTARFRPVEDGRTLLGLVDELALGDNLLEVRSNGQGKGRPTATLTLVNHPAAVRCSPDRTSSSSAPRRAAPGTWGRSTRTVTWRNRR